MIYKSLCPKTVMMRFNLKADLQLKKKKNYSETCNQIEIEKALRVDIQTYIFGSFSVTSWTDVSEPSSIIANLKAWEKESINAETMENLEI